jgi:hypothetical protein
MNRWLQKSKENLLPLSESETFTEAMEEWQTSGQIVEADEGETFVCELCEKEELSTHFGIVNVCNSNSMYVGSKCILKFSGIVVIDPDTQKPVTGDERRLVLNRQLGRLKRAKKKERKDEERRIRDAILAKEQAAALEVFLEEKKKRDAIADIQRRARDAQVKAERDALLARLRELYKRATKSQPFVAEVGKAVKRGDTLTPAQNKGITKLLNAFSL